MLLSEKPFMFISALLFLPLLLLAGLSSTLQAQNEAYWQQEVDYVMDINLDVESHQFNGKQKLIYTNNSPDSLHKFYYHLYFNAFQPNSMMDVRSRTIIDPDRRVGDRISKLTDEEIGYHKIKSLTQNGKNVSWHIEDTILEVELAEPIAPGQAASFEMIFDSQIPLQVRRNGRDSREGIDFSMAQWYPKAAQYDDHGWQVHPYIGREFYPVWGRFDVKITLDANYTIGATGVLQNAAEIGHGYVSEDQQQAATNAEKLTWHFIADDVHDFAWGADEKYRHEMHPIDENRTLHLYYVEGPRTQSWKQLAGYTIQAFDYLDENIGPYPWPQYSVIQGGDGGMEYPMSTLITGERSLGSLVGVTVHELLHSWFQGLFAFDETHYSWMDEGFTSYYSNRVMAHIFGREGDIQRGSHNGYHSLAASGLEEPLTTHSDHYETNTAYGRAAYSKGAVFLDQLEYVIGQEALEAGMKLFYKDWAFKHPRPVDLLKCMETTSGLELDWYFEQWIGTTKRIDYAVTDLNQIGEETHIKLERKDRGVMPIDLMISYEDGSKTLHHIPLGMMRGEKKADTKIGDVEWVIHDDWAWTNPSYDLKIKTNKKISSVELDPTGRLTDYDRLNNQIPFPLEVSWMKPIRPDYNTYQASARPSVWYGQNAGLIAGLSSYGTAFMGDKSMEFGLMLTTGTLTDYSASNTDADFKLKYNQSLPSWGYDTDLSLSAVRYFGIFDISATVTKGLHEFGDLNPNKRFLKLKPFFLAKTSARQTAFLNGGWERGEIYGFEGSYEVGDSGKNGYRLTTVLASFNKAGNSSHVSASSVEFVGNKEFKIIKNVTSRIGVGVGIGSNNMPTQLRWTMAGPTNYQLWQNQTWTGILNIDNDLANNLWLVPGTSGLEGYAHPENERNVDSGENNYMLLNFWNTWAPNNRVNWALEWYMAAGKSWAGDFIGDNPLAVAYNPEMLISSGVGFTYDPSNLRKLRRWIPQSDMLKKTKLTVRVPFYMYGLPGGNDFSPRLLIGISESF